MNLIKVTHLEPVTNGQEITEVERVTYLNPDTIKRIETDARHWRQGCDIQTKFMIVAEMGKQSWDNNTRTMNVFLGVYEYYTNELPSELQP